MSDKINHARWLLLVGLAGALLPMALLVRVAANTENAGISVASVGPPRLGVMGIQNARPFDTDPDLLYIEPRSGSVKPGEAMIYTVHLTNTHSAATGINLEKAQSDLDFFALSLTPTVFADVPPGLEVTAALMVTPSSEPAAPAGFETTTVVTAVFDYTSIHYSDVVSTVVSAAYAVSLTASPQSLTVLPGAAADYTVTVMNTGNAADSFELSTRNSHANFESALSVTTTNTLAPGAEQEIALEVTPPDIAQELENVTTITATSTHEVSVAQSAKVTTTLRVPTIYLPSVFRDYCTPWPVWKTGQNLGDTTVYALALGPRDSEAPYALYAGTAGKGVFKSIDAGKTWKETGLTSELILALSAHPTQAPTVYAATWGSGMQKTTDGGSSWSAANKGLEGHLWLYALDMGSSAAGEPTLYVGTADSGVYRSTDGGGNWTAVNTGLGSLNIRSVAVDPADSRIVYAGTAERGVYKTTDGGDQWKPANTGIADLKVRRIVVIPDSSNLYIGTQDQGVFRSLDAGDSWEPMNGGLGSSGQGDITVYGLAIDPRSSDTLYLYAGTNGDGVYYIPSDGTTWQSMNEGLGDLKVQALVMGPEPCFMIYAATEGGVWWHSPILPDAGR